MFWAYEKKRIICRRSRLIYTGRIKENVYGLVAEGFRAQEQNMRLVNVQFVNM